MGIPNFIRIPNSKLKIVNRVYYQSFIAGALLRLPSIDLDDEIALCKELSLSLTGYSYTPRISQFIAQDNGEITLKEGLTLDSVLENGHTLRKELREIAGDEVLSIFENFDRRNHEYVKVEMVNGKQEVKDKVAILLLDSDEETYTELKGYGFKNIDYFKSIIRADKYFKEHPDELKKYHVIIDGSHVVKKCTCQKEEYYIKLFDTIRNLSNSTDVVYVCLLKIHYGREENFRLVEYDAYVNGESHRAGNVKSLFDVIIGYIRLKNILEKVGYKDKFVPISMPEHSELPLPTKRSDLKILYLNYFYFLSDEEIEKMTQRTRDMGLNVTFKDDNNYTLSEVRYDLGKYDIILATCLYSGDVIEMNEECTEQCRDTGRRLVLLANHSYRDRGKWDNGPCGMEIELKYVHGGNLAGDSSIVCRKFNVLGDNKRDELCIPAILNAAIEAYNERLPVKLTDLDKTSDEYNEEYRLACEEIKQREQAKENSIREAIKRFDNMVDTVSIYIDYRRNGTIQSDPVGISITVSEEDGKISLKNQHQEKITFAMANRKEGYRGLTITIGNQDPMIVALYTKAHEGTSIRKRIDNTQLMALEKFEELVEETLGSLIFEALKEKKGTKQIRKEWHS